MLLYAGNYSTPKKVKNDDCHEEDEETRGRASSTYTNFDEITTFFYDLTSVLSGLFESFDQLVDIV